MRWIVHGFPFEIAKFRDPIPDVITIGVTFLGLRQGVEDPLILGVSGFMRAKARAHLAPGNRGSSGNKR